MVSYAVQKYIAGTDVRVNVVAGELFARRIVTDRVDYRYADRDGGRSRLTEWKLLDELAERCLKLVDYLGLALAGIDLILSDDGEVFCLEVNTSPALTTTNRTPGRPSHRQSPPRSHGAVGMTCGDIRPGEKEVAY